MTVPFSDIEAAFLFVCSSEPEVATAIISRETGEIFYHSDMSGLDELPTDFHDHPEKYVSIPHKIDLDLGRELVFRYVNEHIPRELATMESYFGSRGAYSRFKQRLEDLGKLQEWYDFENAETEKTLRAWCAEKNISVTS